MIFQYLITGASSVGLAALVLFALMAMRRTNRASLGGASRGSISFLFEGERLLDATKPARRLLASGGPERKSLDHLLRLLGPRFPDLRTQLRALDETGDLTIPAQDDSSALIDAQAWGGMMRLTLRADDARSANALSDDFAASRMRDEIASLRLLAEDSPHLMWREQESGVLDWANRAYLDLAAALDSDEGDTWPPQPVFVGLPALSEGTEPAVSRQPVLLDTDQAPRWFEITSKWSDGHTLRIAADVTEEVRARDLQRDLMQTLTKTFAGLAVGLAVFDRNRQLVLFNPALFDLTGIKPARLVTRPAIDVFLNLLREHRAVPELSDFAAWRRQILNMAEGTRTQTDLIEAWDLPDGRRFRVTLRPFPNRAIAMLIEDASSDALLSRRLHQALHIGQEALDGVDEAVCVFSADRELLLENAAVAKMWGGMPADDSVVRMGS